MDAGIYCSDYVNLPRNLLFTISLLNFIFLDLKIFNSIYGISNIPYPVRTQSLELARVSHMGMFRYMQQCLRSDMNEVQKILRNLGELLF